MKEIGSHGLSGPSVQNLVEVVQEPELEHALRLNVKQAQSFLVE